MGLFEILALLITLTAVFSYLNHRLIRLPVSIGVMVIALLFSVGVTLVGLADPALREHARQLLAQVDFDAALLKGMLSFLLFAGALHVDLGSLLERKAPILSLATFGVLISTLLVGGLTYGAMRGLGHPLPLPYCLVFGALISPTDPIAVLGILKSAGIPKSLETKIAGESLFNDGVAVVVFLVLEEITYSGAHLSAAAIGRLFLQEALGGALFGWAIGYVCYRMLKSVDQYQVEVLLTLALVTGGYALASALHLSGPIAIVVAGLLIGNHGRVFAMSEETRSRLDVFWELVDEILNAVLFVLIGLETLALTFRGEYLLAALLIIPGVLLARFVAVGLPVNLLRPFQELVPGTVTVLTWGGLRGGISVALALSLPGGPESQTIVAITYLVVVFSIVVQGLTIGPVVRRVLPRSES